MRLPGPSELLPGRPDAVIDLQSLEGVGLVGGEWRYSDTTVREIDFVDVGADLGPGDVPNRTYEVVPRAHEVEFDDSGWRRLAPEETQLRLSQGRVCFSWYRIAVTIPSRVGDLDPTGSTVVFECAIDDYAEVWVGGQLPVVLGQNGGSVVGGFNAPNRVVLTSDAQPGQTFRIAVFGINGPISTAPANYIWMRTASLDFYRGDTARVTEPVPLRVDRPLVSTRSASIDARLEALIPSDAVLERVATGFEFTEGPVWTRDGSLLFSSPNTNVIYRWTPNGLVSVFRSKSGYAGLDIGDYTQPGSNGLAFDPQGRLTMCQHGNRRVLRVEPHGNTTVLADRFRGLRLNSPNDLVYRSDGVLFFTDPPFGLPAGFDDPKKELGFSGVYAVVGDDVRLIDDTLAGPNGLAFSPDERYLYVGNWDLSRKVVMRYEIGGDASVLGVEEFFDMTDAAGDDAVDGIKVDREGNLYVCGPGGIWVLSSDGEHLGTIVLPESPHNLAWGDDDGQTLYMTALTSIYRLRLGGVQQKDRV